MKPKILIGEMAKLHNISAQTLRYYDNIGLFKPKYIDEENNYRYYGIEQFAQLDSILFLKKLGVSLKDIEKYFNQRNLNSMTKVLEQNKLMIKREMELLKRKHESIEAKLKLLNEYSKETAFYECKIKNLSSRRIVHLNFEDGGSLVHFEYGLKELNSLIKDDFSLFNGLISCLVGTQELRDEAYDYYKSVAILFEDTFESSGRLDSFPGGDFACIAYKGKYENGEQYYKKLLKWINEKNLEIAGEGVFLFIVDSAFSDVEEEFITEIQIPVIKALTL